MIMIDRDSSKYQIKINFEVCNYFSFVTVN